MLGQDALEKLLVKQRADVEQTERLMQIVSDPSDDDRHDDTTHESAIVKSIMSGVHYGFVSRSEGPTFDSTSGDSLISGSYSTSLEGYFGPPSNFFFLGAQQFVRNLNAIRGEYEDEEDVRKFISS